MTGCFALPAQEKAILAQKDRDRETEIGAVKAILHAVKAKLKTFHNICLIQLEEIFKARENTIEARQPLAIAPLKQNYFIVFDSNAAALGKIMDPKNPELLGTIVTTYSAARSLLDSINYNNQRYQVWEPLSRQIGTPEYHAMTENLNNFADSIRTSALKLQTYVTDLIAQIDKYLDC